MISKIYSSHPGLLSHYSMYILLGQKSIEIISYPLRYEMIVYFTITSLQIWGSSARSILLSRRTPILETLLSGGIFHSRDRENAPNFLLLGNTCLLFLTLSITNKFTCFIHLFLLLHRSKTYAQQMIVNVEANLRKEVHFYLIMRPFTKTTKN